MGSRQGLDLGDNSVHSLRVTKHMEVLWARVWLWRP
jgi:hypothetical protein